MYKSWLTFTVFCIIFFILCLIIVIFFNNTVTRSFGEELTLLVATTTREWHAVSTGITGKSFRPDGGNIKKIWRYMNTNRRKKILMAGLSLSAICLIVSLIMLMQPPSGPYSRLAMTGTGIVALLTGMSCFIQLRQKWPWYQKLSDIMKTKLRRFVAFDLYDHIIVFASESVWFV